jgi:hypothetical protein
MTTKRAHRKPRRKSRPASARFAAQQAEWGHLTKPLPCAECAATDADLVTGLACYPHRPELHTRRFWRCSCGAFCGCHPNTTNPLGAPAGPQTRKARNLAHEAIDALWQRKMAKEGCARHVARSAAYAWLAAQLGIDVKDCHISYMGAAMAGRVVAICAEFKEQARARRAANLSTLNPATTAPPQENRHENRHV